MRIAILNTNDTGGGAAIASIRLAEGLIERGHEIDFISMTSSGQFEFVKPLAIKIHTRLRAKLNFLFERINFLFFEKNKSVRFAFSPGKFGFPVSDMKDLRSYDIIHLHWVNFGFLSIHQIGKILALKTPVVWTLHDMWPMTGGCHHSGDCNHYEGDCGNCVKYLAHPSPNDFSNQRMLAKKASFQDTSHLTIVGCSEWIADRARKSSLFKGLNINAIPNPIDLSVFRPLSIKKSEMGLENHKIYIVFVAVKVSVIWKGFYLFKKAVQLLEQQLSDDQRQNIEIIIIGESKPTNFSDFKLKTHLIGPVSSPQVLNKWYNVSDLFVSSSIQENLPNTIIEAMSVGKPCVAFEVGGIPEIIEHKKSGYLAIKESSEDLAKGMKWVIDHLKTEPFSENCQKNATEKFSKKVSINQYLNLYNSLLTS